MKSLIIILMLLIASCKTKEEKERDKLLQELEQAHQDAQKAIDSIKLIRDDSSFMTGHKHN